MKITKKYLQDLIKEEIALLQERTPEESTRRGHRSIDMLAGKIKDTFDKMFAESQAEGLEDKPSLHQMPVGHPEEGGRAWLVKLNKPRY